MLAGQGADELFGGYQRYVKEYCKDGGEKVRKTMFNDVVIFMKVILSGTSKSQVSTMLSCVCLLPPLSLPSLL